MFKKFVPILKAINFAGWRPLRSASLTARTGVPQPPPDKVFVERFGSVRVGTVFWTAHNGDNVSHSGLSLLVETAALGFAAGSYRADELTQSAPLPALHVNSSTHSSLALPSLLPGKTLVIRVQANTSDDSATQDFAAVAR